VDLIESLKPIVRRLERFKYLLLFAGISILGTISALYLFPDSVNSMGASVNKSEEDIQLQAFPIVEPTIKYGFAVDTFQVYEGTIQNGDFLGSILQRYHIDYPSIEELAQNAKPVFNVNSFRIGKNYMVLSKDSTQRADYFIYEPSVYHYVVFDLNKLEAQKVEHKIEYETEIKGGLIESSLWAAITGNGMSYEVASKMEDALQWSIDFHHIQKEDEFKLVYDQEYIKGEKAGVGMIKAAYYKTNGQEFHAIYFDHEDVKIAGYYDLEGRPMKNGFLKSPVKYSRISSYYNLNRFHPILKRRRPHYGTDYAAPYGTPIMAVGNGVIIKAGYTKGNGNYVKIKHDDTYSTQYLHMQKFASTTRVGAHVKQGQVIGYVGSTGLATGPHVCFRFWKNGRQVNHLNMSFPPPEPLPEEHLDEFFAVRDQYLKLLDQAKVKALEEEEIISDSATEEEKEVQEVDGP
jgi:murein DD-endopeptidase MepM/ murein hydrolase activator NlpD